MKKTPHADFFFFLLLEIKHYLFKLIILPHIIVQIQSLGITKAV